MAFTAGSPPGSLCHQVSSSIKKTHLPLGCAHVSPLKEIRDSWLLIKLLAITLPRLLDGFPVCPSGSTCIAKIALAFTQPEKVYVDVKGITAVKAAAGVDHHHQALL